MSGVSLAMNTESKSGVRKRNHKPTRPVTIGMLTRRSYQLSGDAHWEQAGG